MTESLLRNCELFVKNRDILKVNFKWDSSQMHPLCASLCAERDIEADHDKIRECKEIIKENTGLLSEFKGTVLLALATILSFEADPESKFHQVTESYAALRKEFHSSPYLPLSAFMIADMADSFSYEMIVEKSKRIYKKMKEKHPFLTSSEDAGFAVLFALSGIEEDEAIGRAEECFTLLKGRFFSGDSVQALSHALAMGADSSEEKAARTLEIYEKLKERGLKYGTGPELATLGMLSLSGTDVDTIVEDVAELDQHLSSIKGFGTFGTGKAQRLMYASFLTANSYKKNGLSTVIKASLVNSVTSLIIAQQVAVIAIIAATSASSSTSS
jgi:hypothetical protein